jgi:hypothetical protein
MEQSPALEANSCPATQKPFGSKTREFKAVKVDSLYCSANIVGDQNLN